MKPDAQAKVTRSGSGGGARGAQGWGAEGKGPGGCRGSGRTRGGALGRRAARGGWGRTHLLDGGSEGPQHGRGAPAVPLHPWHGGLWVAQGDEREVSGC